MRVLGGGENLGPLAILDWRIGLVRTILVGKIVGITTG